MAAKANLDKAVEMYIKIRDRKDALKKKHAEELAPLTSKMEEIEARIMQFFERTGQSSARTPHGTPYKAKAVSIGMEDRDAFLAFVLKEGAYEFLTNHISKPAVENYVEANGVLPPGVKQSTTFVINIKRGK